MLRVALLLLVVLLLPVEAVAQGGAWHKRKIIVRDYLPQERKATLEAVIAAFNEVMPKRGPRLVYVAMPETPCVRARAKGGIAVCLDLALVSSEATYRQRGHVILNAKVALSEFDASPCHELMHALTDIADDYTEPQLRTSCVQGRLATPGPFDVQYLRWAYKKYGRHR